MYGLFIEECGGEVGEEKYFIIGNLGEFLHELYKMMVFDVDSATVAHHYESGVELPDLVQEEIFYNESNEIALMVLYILLTLEHIREFLTEDVHANREDVYVLIEVLSCLLVLVLVKFLS